jgi:2-polyprenyl-6-methoxyphenol hydroxylase-like FAD-dependent oxidoreductase
MRILIVGGGIAGLSLARALGNAGLTADVVERDSEPRTTGAGFYLPGNAVRALRSLGLGDALAARAQPVHAQRVLDHRGRKLTAFATGDLWAGVGDCFAISRVGLRDLLLGDVLPGVRRGKVVEKVDAEGNVTFGDGAQDSYDLVVGADGIGSAVRGSAFAGAVAPRFLRQVCWRFLADDPAGSARPGEWTTMLGDNGRGFLTLSLGGGQVYCYADIASTEPIAPDGDWRELFGDFAEPAGTLLEQGKDAYFAPLLEIDDDDWVRPHAVLIGDAAHACSPSMAQGGAMALEDSLVLAEVLAGVTRPAGLPVALAAYQQRRRPRVRWVLEQNRRRDKGRLVAPVVRNLVMRLMGEKLYKANHTELLPQP